MCSDVCVVTTKFLIRAPVELPADTVSEQIIPKTRKGSWFGSIPRKRKREDTAKPILETLMTEEPPNIAPEVESTPLQTASPTVNSDPQPASPPIDNISVEPPNQTPPYNVPPTSWPPTTPPRPVPQNVQGVLSKPTHLDLLSPAISISSVDDFVPQLKSSSSLLIPAPPQNLVPIGVGGVGDVTTAAMTGTATSRFTLRIPLLGRPKIPLNQAVAVAQAEDIRNSTPTTPVNGDSTTPLSTPTTEEAQTSGVLAVPPNTSAWQVDLLFHVLISSLSLDVLSEQVDQSQSVGITTLEDTSNTVKELVTEQTREIQDDSQVQQDAAAPPPNSWWNYIGWAGTQPSETTQLPTISIDVAPAIEHTESAGTEFLSAVSTESPTIISNTQSPPSPAQSLPNSDAGSTTKPVSVASFEGQSSWLTPWSWYSSSAVTPPPLQSPLPPVEEGNEQGLTESQMIKETALARDSQPPAAATRSSDPASEGDKDTTENDGKDYPDEVNPIRSTAGANRSGWTSFFMAKSIKSVTEDGEKNPIGKETNNSGMEVMEIPDPEDLPPDPTATTTAASATPTMAPSSTSTMAAIVNQFVPRSSAPSIKSSSSRAPRSPTQLLKEIEKEPERGEKEPKKKDPPAPPMTNSESVKEITKKGPERPSSPSPSKRSGTSTPISPRNGPPNLILPMWEDTFHAPPRSLLPVSMMHKEDGGAESGVTGTIKMLWSRGWEVAGMGSVKGKERAGIQGPGVDGGQVSELGDFGKPLPRALNVVGDKMDPKVSNGTCRIVVIGIAGWSPGAVTRKIAGGVSSIFPFSIDATFNHS